MSKNTHRKSVVHGSFTLLRISLAFLWLASQAQASLIGQWTFNEGSGITALDLSGNGNPGAITGATYVPANDPPGGYALSFDGSGDEVYMGAPALFNIFGASAAYSVMAWMKVESASDFAGFGLEPGIGKAPYRYGFTTYAGTHVYGYGGGGGNSVDSKDEGNNGPGAHADLFTAGAWHQVVVTYDAAAPGPNFYLYIDNAVSDYKTSSLLIGDNDTAPFTVGRNFGGGGASFKGLIDEVRLYNHALSASEISAAFTAGPIPEPTSVALLLVASGGLWILRRRSGMMQSV